MSFSGLHDCAILIVDDEEANVRLLARILARAGYERVQTTTSSRVAVELFEDTRPDLVIMDVHMPELDAFGVLERIGAIASPSEFVPVLAITGDSSPAIRRRVLTSGAKDYLLKPFEGAEVLVRVENLLTTRLLYRALAEQSKALDAMSHKPRTPRKR